MSGALAPTNIFASGRLVGRQVTRIRRALLLVRRMHVSPERCTNRIRHFWVGRGSAAELRQLMSMPVVDLVTCQAMLRRACEQISCATPPQTRMSFYVEISTITGGMPPITGERPPGWGTRAQVVDNLRRYRETANPDAFQINPRGNRDLAQLLDHMARPPRSITESVPLDWQLGRSSASPVSE